ncbi:MAG: N-acyl homoserine lactonase family protein [Pseudomonadota bacterium]
MSNPPAYEVYALLYAKSLRPSRDYFLFPDPHDGPLPIFYYVWLIRGEGRCLLVDTGFSAARAKTRKRDFLRCPSDGLRLLGVEADAVEQVVLTHLHYDHAGNIGLFPAAEFFVQEAEVNFATGRFMRYPPVRAPFEAEDVVDLIRCNFNSRVRFLSGDQELAPGITAHLIGGHTHGLQAVSVTTRRGLLVLASDAAHFFDNMDLQNPFPIVADIPRMMAGHERLRDLAPSSHHIIPGHDPKVMQLYPEVGEGSMIVDLTAEPRALS